jgi:ABC-type multidrug transport system fused ATPase/permease subunit
VIGIIRKLIAILSPGERRQFYLLLGVFVLAALLDVAGIASIIPFMAVLASPEIIQSNRFLNAAYTMLGYEEPDRFLFFLGVLVFVTLVVSIAFKALSNLLMMYFTQMRIYSISCRLVGGYLEKPYEWFLNRHSAELGKDALSEVQFVVDKGFMPMLRILAQGAVVIAILAFLATVDPIIALMVFGVMGGAYGLIFLIFRRLITRIGRDRTVANASRFKVLNEALGGIKEIKLSRMERVALRSFDAAARRFSRTQYISGALSVSPRYVLEAIAFGGMLLLVLVLMARQEGLALVLPVISIYAFAGYRLMPALQMVYNSGTLLRFAAPAIHRLYEDLVVIGTDKKPALSKTAQLAPKQSIRFEKLTYTYPNANRAALRELSLDIPVPSTVGIVGKSGSGKTTTVDVILGLLRPQSGCLWVDDVAIVPDNLAAWQASLGYVPQHIFLSDDSIAANIAFGRSKEDIDGEAVARAARAANLHDFIVEELPEGYETHVGERGVRLSGGQRQRIGIARALYNEPQVLVLDEATSALDNLTEEAVMDAVRKLGGKMTVILIAHRLTTVRDCDRIFMLDNGEFVAEGNYEDLSRSHPGFRALAGHGATKL